MKNKLLILTLCIATLIGCGDSNAQNKEELPYWYTNLKVVKAFKGNDTLLMSPSGTCYLLYEKYNRGSVSKVNCEDFLGESEQAIRDKRSHKQQAEEYSKLLEKLWNEKVYSQCEYGNMFPLSKDSEYGYVDWSSAFKREITCDDPDLEQIAVEKKLLEQLKKKYGK